MHYLEGVLHSVRRFLHQSSGTLTMCLVYWQGGYQKKIKVIGDKQAGKTSEFLSTAIDILKEIRQTLQVPLRFIHIVRNPFDNIATMTLRETGTREAVIEEGTQINNTAQDLEKSINRYFKLAAANQRIRELYGDEVVDIAGHETILRPKETLQRLCDHLNVACSEDYFEKCSNILFSTPSITRHKVVWTEEQKVRVTQMMKNYSFENFLSISIPYNTLIRNMG